MSAFPEITLVRHGETAWSLSGQHTGRSDIPLTANGEAAARALAPRLAGLSVSAVWSSPSQRAHNTCRLAGFGEGAAIKPDLAEWDYGAYEGITTREILARRPGWRLFRDGCPDGESAADIGARADRIVAELRAQLAAAQKVTEATVEGGNVTVRTVHKAIAAIPFGILESIPATRDTTRVVRRIHDAISDGIYGTISAANKAVHGAARNAVNPLQPESPPDRKDPPP